MVGSVERVIMVAKGTRLGDATKEKVAAGASRTWKDPKVRKARSEAMKVAWVKRKERMMVCQSCGQPLPEESGR